MAIDAMVLRLPQWGGVPADESGFVDSGLLPPGTYELTVRARDHGALSLGKKVLHPNEVLELGEIRIGK